MSLKIKALYVWNQPLVKFGLCFVLKCCVFNGQLSNIWALMLTKILIEFMSCSPFLLNSYFYFSVSLYNISVHQLIKYI